MVGSSLATHQASMISQEAAFLQGFPPCNGLPLLLCQKQCNLALGKFCRALSASASGINSAS